VREAIKTLENKLAMQLSLRDKYDIPEEMAKSAL
jgi:hypothetical protein